MGGVEVDVKKGDSGYDSCCHLCEHTFREPYGGKCGHAACKSCLAVLYTRDLPDLSHVLCRKCGATLTLHELKPDKAAERRLQKLKTCKCRNCNWRGPYNEYIQNHERDCGGIIRIQCKVFGCGKWLPKDKALELHRSDDWCPMILLMKARLSHAEIVHLSMRESWSWTCGLVLKSDKQSVSQYIERLVQVFSVLDPSVPVALENDEYAATHIGSAEGVEDDVHGPSSPDSLSSGQQPFSDTNRREVKIQNREQGSLRTGSYLDDQVSTGAANVISRVGATSNDTTWLLSGSDQGRIRHTQERLEVISDLQKDLKDIERRMRKNEVDWGTHIKDIDGIRKTLDDIKNMPRAFAALDEKYSVFEGIMATLNNEIIALCKRMDALKAPRAVPDTGILEKLVKANQEINRSITSLAQSLQKLDTRVLDVEASHTGIFVWKINFYSQKKREAQSTNNKSIYSPPFFTSQYGYKLCGRVFIMGDGVGKGTHISLFLTILKGPYDAVLAWPFKEKITFQLVNQDDPINKSITEAFRPDPASSSFKKPTSDRNIGAGCPLFAKLQVIEDPQQGFIKDDTLYFKLVSQTSDLPENK